MEDGRLDDETVDVQVQERIRVFKPATI